MKRCVSLCLACIVFVTLLSNRAFALSSPYSPPDCVQESLNVGDSYVIQPKYGEREEVTVLKREETTVETTPSGQPRDGFSFPAAGSSVLISKTGGPTVEVSLSVSWKIFTVSIGAGFVADHPSISTITVNIPADNNYYRVKLVHTYLVEHLRVEQYRYNEHIGTAYVDKYRVIAVKGDLEKTRTG